MIYIPVQALMLLRADIELLKDISIVNDMCYTYIQNIWYQIIEKNS
jgi:hypothetical protein